MKTSKRQLRKRPAIWDGRYMRPAEGAVYFTNFSYLGLPDRDWERIRSNITNFIHSEFSWLLINAAREYLTPRALADNVFYFQNVHKIDPVVIGAYEPICVINCEPNYYFFKVIASNGIVCWIHRSFEPKLIEKTFL
jgi:hypothetical protein